MKYNTNRIRPTEAVSTTELADLLGIAPGTVSRWASNGLPKIDNKYPSLFYGENVIRFLNQRRSGGKSQFSEKFFCVGCRKYTTPSLDIVRIDESSDKLRVVGRCSLCPSEFSEFTTVEQIEKLESFYEVVRERGRN